MYTSRGPGVGVAAGLAYTGVATGFYLVVALVVVVAGLLLVRAARLRKADRR